MGSGLRITKDGFSSWTTAQGGPVQGLSYWMGDVTVNQRER